MMPELAFVAFNPSTKIQSATVRRTVRSQAAKSGQPQRRAPRVKRQARFQAVDTGKHVRAVVVASPTKAWDHSPSATARCVPESGLLTPLTGKSSTSGSRSTSEVDSGSEKSFKLISEPTHPVLMMQPLLARPYSPLLNHYYLSCMAINIPDLDLDTPGILRVLWFPYVLMNDGILSVILLLAGASFANSRYISERQMADIRSSLIELKAHSLLSIRRMIGDPNTSSSDVAIATVLKMASYESTFGSTDAYHLHMTALKQMVQGRGGVGSLGLEGLLARMILWVDYNAACLINTRMHFLEESSGLPKPMEFGPDCFVGYE